MVAAPQKRCFDRLVSHESERTLPPGLQGVWLLAMVLLLVAGCGRTALERQCTVDQECAEGWVCLNEVCTPEEIEEEDTGPIPPDGGEIECSDDLDCGDGVCRLDGDICTVNTCNTSTGQCVVSDCNPDCGAGTEAVGCECFPVQCTEDEECLGRICEDGTCRGCVSDGECSADGSMICGDNGICEEGPECQIDDHCRPFEVCDDEVCVDRPECTFDDDCGESEQCIAGVCTYTPDCEDDSQCSAQAECVGGVCQTRLCRGNSDCPDDELCDAGECVPPPVSTDCIVITDAQTIAPNERIPLEAFAFNDLGQGVAASFVWNSSDPSVAEIDGQDLVGNSSTGLTTVTATLAGGDPIVCSGNPSFENLGITPQGEVRVRVVHMDTGAAIEGAEVHIGDNSAISSATGVVNLPRPDGAFEVSVFHDNYNYLTVQGISARDLRMPISPRSGSGPVAGFTGQFDMSQAQTSGDIELGIAGASLAGDLLDINLGRLLGDPFVTPFEVTGLGGADVPLPGGITAHGEVLNFQLEGKQTYYAQSAAGARLSWGLAGRIPFMDLFPIFSNPPETVGEAIGTFLPLFSRFDHGQQPVILEALPRVLDTQDINNNGITDEWLPDYDAFPEEDLMPSVRQQLTTEIAISSLPFLGGQRAEVAVLVGGTLLDGPGFMPLGISAVSDDSGAGQPDARTLYMAPQYGSAVGGRYAVLALAFSTEGEDVAGDFSAALWNGQSLPTGTSLGTFPDSSAGVIDEGQRTVSVDATAGPIFRVRLVATERSWDIWSMGPEGVAGEFTNLVSMPQPPAGRSDIFGDGGSVLVDSIRSSVSIDDLVRSSGVGLRRAGLVTTSFNRTTFR